MATIKHSLHLQHRFLTGGSRSPWRRCKVQRSQNECKIPLITSIYKDFGVLKWLVILGVREDHNLNFSGLMRKIGQEPLLYIMRRTQHTLSEAHDKDEVDSHKSE